MEVFLSLSKYTSLTFHIYVYFPLILLIYSLRLPLFTEHATDDSSIDMASSLSKVHSFASTVE